LTVAITVQAQPSTGRERPASLFGTTRAFVERRAIWLVLLVLIGCAGLLSPVFLNPINLFNIVRQSAVVGIASIGVTLVMITRGVDLSVGAVISLAAVLGAALMGGQDGNVAQAVAITLLVGTLVGAINGLLIALRGLPPFILTLGMAVAVQGSNLLYTGGTAYGVVAPGYREVVNQRLGPVPLLVLIFAAVLLVGLLIQNGTLFGRRLYLVGGNPEAARLSGVNVSRTLFLAYTCSGFTAALAGLVLLARSGVSSNFAGQGYEFDALAAVVLGGTTFEGGKGGIGGTLAGVLILLVAFNLVNILGLNFNAQLVLKGSIIIGAAALYRLAQRRD
jgi:ribose transport system permease protein